MRRVPLRALFWILMMPLSLASNTFLVSFLGGQLTNHRSRIRLPFHHVETRSPPIWKVEGERATFNKVRQFSSVDLLLATGWGGNCSVNHPLPYVARSCGFLPAEGSAAFHFVSGNAVDRLTSLPPDVPIYYPPLRICQPFLRPGCPAGGRSWPRLHGQRTSSQNSGRKSGAAPSRASPPTAWRRRRP